MEGSYNSKFDMEGSYDYSKELVSCPTFSSGVDVAELIWPTVMDHVLDFFKNQAEKMQKPGRDVEYDGLTVDPQNGFHATL